MSPSPITEADVESEIKKTLDAENVEVRIYPDFVYVTVTFPRNSDFTIRMDGLSNFETDEIKMKSGKLMASFEADRSDLE